MKHTCFKYGIRTHFRGNRTLKQILVKPKDKDPEGKKIVLSTATSVQP